MSNTTPNNLNTPTDPNQSNDTIDLLLETIHRKYGYDFRDYSRASMQRRILQRLKRSGLESLTQMIRRVEKEKTFFESLLPDLTVNVTEMFRDPSFFKALRRHVVPILNNHSFIKIWHAGCATGEEVYSTAILLKEESMNQHTRTYATDIDNAVLAKAQKGIFPLKNMKQYSHNYRESGGKDSFADYYRARYHHIIMAEELRKNILFSHHNLVSDGVFGEMSLVMCRNVLIYFNPQLQERVIDLFYRSLYPGGILCLGSKETLRFSRYVNNFEPLVEGENLYRKKLDII